MKNENKITMRNFRTHLLNKAVKEGTEGARIFANVIKQMSTKELKKLYSAHMELENMIGKTK